MLDSLLKLIKFHQEYKIYLIFRYIFLFLDPMIMREMKRSKLCDEFATAMNKHGEVELFYKAFLKPMEIALKTSIT